MKFYKNRFSGFLCIALLILILNAPVVYAESGTIVVTQINYPSYTLGSGCSGTLNAFTTFRVDLTKLNSLNSVHMSIPSVTFAAKADFSSFTITSGGTGSGIVAYDAIAQTVDYYFNSGNTITANPFVITLGRNIFSGAAGFANNCDESLVPATGELKVLSYPSISNRGIAATYSLIYTNNVGNKYDVTYPAEGLFNVFINKSMAGIVTSNVTVWSYDFANLYFDESTFNTNNYNYTSIYSKGIGLKMKIANGGYSTVVVNSTTVNVSMAAVGQLSVSSPVQVNTIPQIGYNIQNYDPDLRYFIYLVFPNSDVYWEDSISGSTGTKTWSCCTWNRIGVWRAELWSWNKDFSENAIWTLLDTQSVSVIGSYEGLNGYFSYPNSSVTFNSTGPWTFIVNVSQATTHYTVQVYAPDTWYTGVAPIEESAPVLGNSTFIQTIIGEPVPGPYWAQIYDSDNGLFVNYTLFYVSGYNATTGYNNTYLSCSCGTKLDADLYKSLTLFYSSNGTGLLKVTDPENQVFYQSNVGTGYASKIVNLGTLSDNKLGNWVVTLTDAAGLTKTITVRVFKSTVNFAPGWYLSTDKTSYVPGDVVKAEYSFPAEESGVRLKLSDGEATTVFDQVMPKVTGIGSASIVLPAVNYACGSWYLQLLDNQSIPGAVKVINVSGAGCSGGSGSGGSGSVEVTDPIAATNSLGNNLMWFISLPMFWGLIIWILVVYSVAQGKQGEDRSKSIELVAVIGAGLEAIVGLWEPYTWFVIVLIVIALGSKFYAARKIQSGGE